MASKSYGWDVRNITKISPKMAKKQPFFDFFRFSQKLSIRFERNFLQIFYTILESYMCNGIKIVWLGCEKHCCKANMVELKQTKLSDRSTVGRVWDSEFEGYRFDSRNRQIFATSENSKIYFSNIIQIICYLETLICLIIFVNNIDLLQVVLIYSLMSLNVLILRSKNSLQTDCIISRFEYTVSLWCPDQDLTSKR